MRRMISLLAVMQSGDAIETGIVGAEGVLGGTPQSTDISPGRRQSKRTARLS